MFVLGVYFMVRLAQHTNFGDEEIIKFDKIITNIGGGYIDDDAINTDYGKFIAPQRGTYQFSANVFNRDKLIAADLMKNGMLIIGTSNGGRGTGSLSAILDLKEGDEVYLRKPHWVEDDAAYNHYFTSFSGGLLR